MFLRSSTSESGIIRECFEAKSTEMMVTIERLLFPEQTSKGRYSLPFPSKIHNQIIH
jgi:hypothetical protein